MPWRNQILVGDALEVAGGLPRSCLDLIYVDPPYFTERTHEGNGRPSAGEGPADNGRLHFEDRWQGGRREYLSWLEARVRAMRETLRPEGVFLLHLDWHVVHYAKVLCDEIFGDEHFQNELIWHYQTGGASKGRFSRKHDTILMYALGERFYFDGKAIAIPRTAGAMKRAHSGKGARIAVTDTHKNPDDVLMVPALNPMATERTGYPTQKPIELLEKLITALCPAGGAVADFFCGSGTTLAAAKKLGRHYVGCDVSEKAVALAKRRLQDTSASLPLIKLSSEAGPV
jgi:site-specific DNA-methyltransferase (adenine-specific)